ncbi:hypothetical protein M8818_007118 [Zalaria obscura]|uniref:Uncharacterized protein n=1 Tax=Zalaria obscura TaxID=2024903 RepID=A0ACC3S4Z5_9PEZI
MAHQQNPFPAYGYCDSYFVENHDDDNGIYAQAAAERERQRNIAKVQQKALGDELSQLTADEYQEDILDHMEYMEGETMPDINSIEIQTEIQWFMRPYLLDFLLEAHHAFQLLPETLFLAVNLLDRYCSKRVVYKRHYQLVGCASLLIAAKYGDRKERVPTIKELKSMCCSLYDDDMFTQMEWHVLQTLNWQVGHPTVTSFLQLALTEVEFDPEVEHLTWYICENALYHKEFIMVRPSVMARSALALARWILSRPDPHQSEWAGRYEPQVVIDLHSRLPTPSQALFRKYSSHLLSSVSNTTEAFLQRQALMERKEAEANVIAMEQQYLTPQTPQKPGYAVPIGVLTPPITPEHNDYLKTHMYGVQHNMQPRMQACTPTPPPSTMHQPQYTMNFAQPQYIQ